MALTSKIDSQNIHKWIYVVRSYYIYVLMYSPVLIWQAGTLQAKFTQLANHTLTSLPMQRSSRQGNINGSRPAAASSFLFPICSKSVEQFSIRSDIACQEQMKNPSVPHHTTRLRVQHALPPCSELLCPIKHAGKNTDCHGLTLTVTVMDTWQHTLRSSAIT